MLGGVDECCWAMPVTRLLRCWLQLNQKTKLRDVQHDHLRQTNAAYSHIWEAETSFGSNSNGNSFWLNFCHWVIDYSTNCFSSTADFCAFAGDPPHSQAPWTIRLLQKPANNFCANKVQRKKKLKWSMCSWLDICWTGTGKKLNVANVFHKSKPSNSNRWINIANIGSPQPEIHYNCTHIQPYSHCVLPFVI